MKLLNPDLKKINVLIVVNSDSYESFNTIYSVIRKFKNNPVINTVAIFDMQENQIFFDDFDVIQSQNIKVSYPDVNYSFLNFKSYALHDVECKDFEFVLMRMDAPLGYDLQGLYRKLENVFSAQFYNNLDGMLEFGSKKKLAEIQEALTFNGLSYIPKTKNCQSAEEIHNFKQEIESDIVIKSFYGYGGKEVFLMRKDGTGDFETDESLNLFIQKVGGEVCVQRFVSMDRVIDDRVILIFDYKTKTMKAECILRRTALEGTWRANMTLGATAELKEIDERHIKMTELLGPELIDAGIYLAGVDVMYDKNQLDQRGRPQAKITEINCRNVGGLSNVTEWSGVDYVEKFTNGICFLFLREQYGEEGEIIANDLFQ